LFFFGAGFYRFSGFSLFFGFIGPACTSLLTFINLPFPVFVFWLYQGDSRNPLALTPPGAICHRPGPFNFPRTPPKASLPTLSPFNFAYPRGRSNLFQFLLAHSFLSTFISNPAPFFFSHFFLERPFPTHDCAISGSPVALFPFPWPVPQHSSR